MVIFYADSVTGSMKAAIDETNRRRDIQEKYNQKHNITPQSIKKEITNILTSIYEKDYWTVPAVAEDTIDYGSESDIKHLEDEMKKAAERLEFEKAAELRDRINAIRKRHIEIGIIN
jgi:excinuclease ABC subunit B